jgi:hypothetical protein
MRTAILMTAKRRRQLAACTSATERAALEGQWQAIALGARNYTSTGDDTTTLTLTRATTTATATQGEHNPMATPKLQIRPVPDSITEARAIRDAKANGTYKETPLPSVAAHRQDTFDQANARRAEVARLEVARMRDYVIPDSLTEGRRLRAERNAAIAAQITPKG